MIDDLGAAHGVVHPLVAAQLPLDDLDVGEQIRQVGAVAGGEVVEDADVFAALDERANEIRADETTAARDEHFHGVAVTW